MESAEVTLDHNIHGAIAAQIMSATIDSVVPVEAALTFVNVSALSAYLCRPLPRAVTIRLAEIERLAW